MKLFYAHIEVVVFESLKENVNVLYCFQAFDLSNFYVRMINLCKTYLPGVIAQIPIFSSSFSVGVPPV